MEFDPTAKVTPEEIIGSILDEMRRSVVPAWYTDFVPNVFRVYLFREDFELTRALERPIREQAVRALDEALEELNKPPQRLFRNKAHAKRYQQLGPWSIEFLENSDDDAAANRLIVRCIPPVPPANDSLEGSATVRVNPEVVSSEDESKTIRTSFAGPPPPSNLAPHARLSYEDDTGKRTYEMTKDLIKIGRGGVDYLVDVKLLTKPDVGREHLQIRHESQTGKFWVKDMSKFGTWMNGQQLPSSVTLEGGGPRDRNLEIEIPSKARLNLANIIEIEFKKLR